MCLLEFEEEETAIEMPCHHLFHSNCILPWLSKVGVRGWEVGPTQQVSGLRLAGERGLYGAAVSG